MELNIHITRLTEQENGFAFAEERSPQYILYGAAAWCACVLTTISASWLTDIQDACRFPAAGVGIAHRQTPYPNCDKSRTQEAYLQATLTATLSAVSFDCLIFWFPFDF